MSKIFSLPFGFFCPPGFLRDLEMKKAGGKGREEKWASNLAVPFASNPIVSCPGRCLQRRGPFGRYFTSRIELYSP